MPFVKTINPSSGRPKHWCFECRSTVLTHVCNKHGCDPVFRHSNKLRVPNYKNKAKFRRFVEVVQIFFNCVSPDQEHYLKIVGRELKLSGKNVNGRVL